ncbi:hypothetical protein IHQ71_03785 [Rhizobium sp. TH2]|uniref:hypothetical protein n=1 Tax=Rhizobium sp. TH2 TaxID=2775403 RepID=UPI002157C6AF|nr:hypothetical protein [Rhizobium sp. TH2]UVC09748.1 hypothetical protein IHQ71_03785 [Rhizobium sp. TH2]
MLMMNGFAMGFFFPKQAQMPPVPLTEKPRKTEYKITVMEPAKEREAEEPAIFALHAHRFF